MVGLRYALLAVVAISVIALAAPAQAAKPPVFQTPGYDGKKSKKAPRTKPPRPPAAIQLSGAGKRPQVLVDDAGTAHIVWNEEGGDNPDVMRYCRLTRGSRACDNPDATRGFVPQQPDTPGNSPAFNEEYEGPRVVALGEQLVLITRRYPNGVPKPPGGDPDTSVYIWVSDDGGDSFTGPGLVGDGHLSGGAFPFNVGGSDRIGTISDTATGGTYFQALRPGAFVAGVTNLGEGDVNRAYYGSLAPEGSTIATAFGDLSNQIFVRRWMGIGDPADATTWTQEPPIQGSEPRLAGGPSGLFMMSRLRPTGGYSVRRLTPGSAGRAVAVSNTRDATFRDFFQDAGGVLHAGWVNRQPTAGSELLKRVSADGRTFRTASLLARAPSIGGPDLAGAFDSGGFAVFENGSGIAAAAFGNPARTGRPGLGAKSGGGLPPGTVSSCQRVSFGAVQISADEGCLLASSAGGAEKVSEGTLRLNGLEIVPDAGVKLIVDPRAHTLRSTGTARVLLRAPGIGEIVLWRGVVRFDLKGGGIGKNIGPFDMGKFPAVLKGFPMEGKVDVFLERDGVRIPIFLRLPKVFGGITGEAVLRADTKRGLHLDTLKIAIGNTMIGPLELKKLRLEYTASSDRWDGDFLLGLPPRPLAGDLGAGATFEGGEFIRGSVNVPLPPPGVPLFTGVYLTQVGGEFRLKPLEITGTITVTAAQALRMVGTVKAKFPSDAPSEFSATATFFLYQWQFADAKVLFRTDGFFQANVNVNIDLVAANVKANALFFVDGPQNAFGSELNADVCMTIGFELCFGAEGVISSKGIGACGKAFGGAAYATYPWGGDVPGDVDVDVGDSCNLDRVRVQPSVAQAGGATFRVARDSRAESLSIAGQGGPPSVVLVSPGGERITPAPTREAGVRAWGGPVPALSETVVAIDDPEPGNWSVEAAPGSPAITGIEQKTDRGPLKLSARVLGGPRGKRRLTYRVEQRTGVRVRFAERGTGGGGEIGYARAARGTLTFEPAPGRAGRRRIVAIVERDGLPTDSRTLASYRAPGPRRPARVKGLRARRSGSAVTIRWRAAFNAARYVVRVRTSRGLSRSYLVKKRLLRVRGIRRGDRVSVTVRGLSELGLQGRATTQRMRR